MPESDSTQQPADPPQLRRSSRVEQNKLKQAAEKKALELEAEETQKSLPKQTKAKLAKSTRPGSFIKQSKPSTYQDASTQLKTLAYRDASTQTSEAKKPLSHIVQPWLQSVGPEESPEAQHNLQHLYLMANSARGQEMTPSSGFGASGTSGTTKRLHKTVASRTAQLDAHQSSLVPEDGKDSITTRLEDAMRRDIGLSETDLKGLLDILSKCIAGAEGLRKDSERYQHFKTFRRDLNEALPACHLFTLTEDDFEKDQMRCLKSKEALLQRTLLYSSTDRWRMEDCFVVDGEDTWKVAPDYRLPDAREISEQSEAAGPNPTPDLAISFDFNKICAPGTVERDVVHHINSKLITCVHPDGIKHRCFPFLFVEAKPKRDSIDLAVLDGTYAANQALQNIYSCMERAGTTEDFDKVRCFSIGMNAERMEVRVHFARLSRVFKTLYFHFFVADSGGRPLKNSLSPVIRSILQDYASPTLLPILQRTFKRLIRAVTEEKIGSEATRECFGVDFETNSESEQESSGSSVETEKSSVQPGDSQRRGQSNQRHGRRQRPSGKQQGRAGSKKRPKRAPTTNSGPSAANAEAGESYGASQVNLNDED